MFCVIFLVKNSLKQSWIESDDVTDFKDVYCMYCTLLVRSHLQFARIYQRTP